MPLLAIAALYFISIPAPVGLGRQGLAVLMSIFLQLDWAEPKGRSLVSIGQ